MRKLKGQYKKCKYCGIEFYEYLYLKGKRKFCSKNCANKANANKLSKDRKGKGNPMYGKNPWNKGKMGVQKGRQGKENYFWKGGRSDDSHKARVSSEWKKWRKEVFERDDYICRICGERGGKLIPHHIKLYRFYVEDRYKINNGVTLCEKCHRKLHNQNRGKKVISISDYNYKSK